MNEAEQILLTREITMFVAIENQSLCYGPSLLSCVFPTIPSSIQNSRVVIIPTKGIEQDCLMSSHKQSCFGRELMIYFVRSNSFVDSAFLFEITPVTYKQTIEFFSEENRNFIRQIHCRQVVVCDIENLRGRDFIYLFNTASDLFSKESIDVILASIIGHTSRSSTDIEAEAEYNQISKEYYFERNSHDLYYVNKQDFKFVLVKKYFSFSILALICSSMKDPSSQLISIIKDDGLEKSCKELCDLGAIQCILANKLKFSPDINTFTDVIADFKLKDNIGFNILYPDWNSRYEKLCNMITKAKSIKEQKKAINNLVGELENDIDKLELFIHSL